MPSSTNAQIPGSVGRQIGLPQTTSSASSSGIVITSCAKTSKIQNAYQSPIFLVSFSNEVAPDWNAEALERGELAGQVFSGVDACQYFCRVCVLPTKLRKSESRTQATSWRYRATQEWRTCQNWSKSRNWRENKLRQLFVIFYRSTLHAKND
jgi:hypothetical protein